MELNQAIKIIRKELLIKDEPLKAWNLLKHFKDLPGLEKERKNTYGIVRHVFEPEWLKKLLDIPVEDCEKIEPAQVALNPGIRYSRYKWVIDALSKHKVKSMIDLGCYVGSIAIYAAKCGIKATGVDMTSGAIRVAKQRARELKTDVERFDLKFIQHDITTFKPKEKVDFVSCMEAFEHVVCDPQEFIDHIASMLKPGGWAYVTTPDGPYGDGEGNIKGGWEWDGKLPRGHVRVFVKETLRPLLKNYTIGELFTQDGLLCFSYKNKEAK